MKLSVITINRNNDVGLHKTIDSVFSQTFRDFEYVIIDGASSDDSVNIIKSSELRADGVKFKWISEQDTGIYNAMNKGINLCTGEYTLMLNSGDYFVDEHVVARIITDLDGTDIVQGNIITVCDGQKIVSRGYGKSSISFIEAMAGHFLHQASFCRKDLFERYGCFDESYRINGDTVFYAKCLAFGNATFRYVDKNIAFFDTTGLSSDPDGKWIELRKDEDLRYQKMFSKRMWRMQFDEAKKIKMYDQLHAHRVTWALLMLIVHISDLIYRGK